MAASQQDILKALRAADAAGNVDDARRLAQLASSYQAPTQAPAAAAPATAPEPDPLTAGEWLKGRGQAFAGGIAQQTAGVLRTAAGGPSAATEALPMLPMGFGALQQAAKSLRQRGTIDALSQTGQQFRQEAQETMPQGGMAKWGTELTDSTLNMLPAVVASMITKSPSLGLGAMGGQVYGDTYESALGEGKTPESAAMEAARAVAWELGPEKAFGFFDKLPVAAGVKDWLMQGVREAASEITTSALTQTDEALIQGEQFPGLAEAAKRALYEGSLGMGMGLTLGAPALLRDKQAEQPPEPEADLSELAARVIAEEEARQKAAAGGGAATATPVDAARAALETGQIPTMGTPAQPTVQAAASQQAPVDMTLPEIAQAALETNQIPAMTTPAQPTTQAPAAANAPVDMPIPQAEQPVVEPQPAAAPEAAQPESIFDKQARQEKELTATVGRDKLPKVKRDGKWVDADPRLMRQDYRSALLNMTTEIVKGGNAGGWVQVMASNVGVTTDGVKQAVNAALTGRKLGVRQEEVIRLMLENVRSARTGEDPKYGPQFDTWQEMLKDARTRRQAQREISQAEFSDDPAWDERYADDYAQQISDEYSAAYEQYAQEESSRGEATEQSTQGTEETTQQPETPSEGVGQATRAGGQAAPVRAEIASLVPEPTAEEVNRAESDKRTAERNGLGRPEVAPSEGDGELFAGNTPGQRPEQATIPDAEAVVAYHGGTMDVPSRQSGLLFVTKDKRQAKEYAKENGGRVNKVSLEGKNIATEKEATEVMEANGIGPESADWSVSDSSLYELIDSHFEQFIGHDNVKKLQALMAEKGFDGIEFTDYDIVKGGHKGIKNIALFNNGQNTIPDAPAPTPNKIFTKEAVAAARERLRKKAGTFNSGVDPQDLADMAIIAGGYVESGIRSFATFSRAMIDEFGAKVKPYLKELFDQAMSKIGATPTDAPKATKPAEQKPAEQSDPNQSNPTSQKKAVVDAEREARGKGPSEKVDAPTKEERLEAARQQLIDDPSLGEATVNEILNATDVSISTADQAILTAYRVILNKELQGHQARAAKGDAEARQSMFETEFKLNRLDMASRAVGAVWSEWGRFTQQMINEDFSFVALKRKFAAIKGAPLNKEEESRIEKQAAEIAALQEKLTKREERAATRTETAGATQAYDKLAKRVEKALRGKNREAILQSGQKDIDEALAELDALARQVSANPMLNPAAYAVMAKLGRGLIKKGYVKLADFIDQMRARLPATFGGVTDEDLHQIFATARDLARDDKILTGAIKPEEIVFEAKTLAEAGEPLDHITVYELAKAHIAQGMRGEDAVMEAVFNDLKEIFPGITERDVRRAFSEYGQTTRPSQEPVKKELRKLRELVRMQESIDRLNEGLEALKTGPQRDKAVQEVRDKQKALNIMLKQFALQQTEPNPERLAGITQARITRLNNRLEDLQREIDTGQKPVRSGVKVADTPEVEELKAKVKVLQDKLDRIYEAQNPPISEEQAQLEKLAEIREHLDRVLAAREPARAKRDFVPLTDGAATIKAEIDELRKLVAKMRRELKDPRTREEKIEAAAIKKLETAIAIYERKLTAGDFSPLYDKGSKAPASARVQALRELRDLRRAAWRAASQLTRPVLTRAEKINANRQRALKRKMAEIERRIREKDYSPEKKPAEVEDDKETARLRYELDKVKRQFHEDMIKANYGNLETWEKAVVNLGRASNAIRAIQTSIDDSGILRQAGTVVLAHPKLLLKNFPSHLTGAFSEADFHRQLDAIKRRKLYRQMQIGEVHIGETNTADLQKAEEAFTGAFVTQPLEVKGRDVNPVAISARAYVGFLNGIRADLFELFYETLLRDPSRTPTVKELKYLGRLVNTLTGRSQFRFESKLTGKEQTAGSFISTLLFFAPKYVASRFSLVLGMPIWFAPTGRTRMIAIQEYLRYARGVSVLFPLLILAALAARDDDDDRPVTSFDSTSSDFMKVRFGDTKVDMFSGMLQPIVMMSRIFQAESTNMAGTTEDLTPMEMLGVAAKFGWSKAAPIPSAITNTAFGANVVGDPTNLANEVMSLPVPLGMRDVAGLLDEHSPQKAAALYSLVFFGMGAQTYGDGGWSEKMGEIDRTLKAVREEVEAQPTNDAKLAKFREKQEEYPWLLQGATLERYVMSRDNYMKDRAGDVKPGAPIKGLPEAVKGDDTKLIKAIGAAQNKVTGRGKSKNNRDVTFAEVEDMAEYSATLARALEAGDLARKVPYSMKMDIANELEESARRLKKENLAAVRRAEGR